MSLRDGETPERILVEALFGGPDGVIEAQEARGQAKLVESELLPTEIIWSTEQDFLDLGFEFGEPQKDDPIFRPAKLPEGWKKVPTDHSMWSAILDEQGRERVQVFYKAAFYDRSAHMGLVKLKEI